MKKWWILLVLLLSACGSATPTMGEVHVTGLWGGTPVDLWISGKVEGTALPSPTGETVYTSTPTPLPTLPPTVDRCLGTVTASTLNVRAAPGGAIVGKETLNDRLTIEGLSPDAAWYKIYDGWVSATWIKLDDSSYCSKLPVINPVARWTPPAEDGGLHLLFSAQADPVLVLVRAGTIGNIKGTDGSEAVLRAARAARPELLLVWRNLWVDGVGQVDCPPTWGAGDPQQAAVFWWGRLYETWTRRGLVGLVDFFEVVNECGYVGQWETAFDLALLEKAQAAGICLALFSDAYGNPLVEQFTQRKPVLDYMLTHECQPGKHPVAAEHIYEGVNGGLWKFGRWTLFLAALQETKYRDLQWLFTEYGYELGIGTVNCGAFVTDWRAAREAFASHPEVLGFEAFAVGDGTGWTDLTPCLRGLTN